MSFRHVLPCLAVPVCGLRVFVALGSFLGALGCTAPPVLHQPQPQAGGNRARAPSVLGPKAGDTPRESASVLELLDQGRQALMAGKASRARALFRDAAALEPESGEPLIWLGMAASAEHASDSRSLFEAGLARLVSATGASVQAEFPVGLGFWLPAGTGIDDIEWDSSGGYLVMAVGEMLRVYETRGYSLVRHWELACDTVFDLALGGAGLLAAGCGDESIRVWDIARASPIHRLEGHTMPVTEVAFAPDGKILASGSTDNTIRTWDLETGTALDTVAVGGAVEALAFSPDGLRLIALVDDWANSACRAADEPQLEPTAPPGDTGHSKDSKGATLCIVDVNSGRISTRQPARSSPSGHSMDTIPGVDRWATAEERSVRLWDSRGRALGSLELDPVLDPLSADHARDAQVDRDGRIHVLTGGDEPPVLSRYPLKSSAPDQRIPARLMADRFRLAPEGERVVLWSRYPAWAPVVARLASGQVVHDFDGQTERTVLLATEQAEGSLIAWSEETRFELDGATGAVTRRSPAIFAPYGLSAVSANGRRYALWKRHATTVSLYDGSTSELIRDLPIGPASTATMARSPSATFSRDGRVLAVAGNGHVRWYDAERGTSLGTIRGWSMGIALDDTGTLLALSSFGDGSVRSLAPASTTPGAVRQHGAPQRSCRLPRHGEWIQSLAFGAGPRLATLAYDGVRLFDAKTCAPVHGAYGGELLGNHALAFSADGRWLAFSNEDQVSVLSTDSWQLETSFHSQGPNFTELAFSPGGRLYGVTWDGTLYVWSLETHKLALVRVVEGSSDSYVFALDDTHRFELFGNGGRSHGACGVGRFRFPLDACEHRLEARGLLASILGKRQAH